jgi:DNA-directed RNA polymerase subunit RPC12/RpoP
MENCARCGKQLAWNEEKMVFWNKQLKKGYMRWFVVGSMQMGKRKEFPEYAGKKLCQVCAHHVFHSAPDVATEPVSQQPKEPVSAEDATADFASLRAFLTQNGVVASAFNCPKCNEMVNIPEAGKLLICPHCGNPIKPTDIYQKIKTLIE